jgi:HEAT repeat protein
MIWWILGGILFLVAGYILVNILVSSFSQTGRIARAIRNTSDATERQQLVSKLIELDSDAALFHIAKLGLSDESEAIRSLAFDSLLQSGPRAVLPIIGTLDSPRRVKSCTLLGLIGDRMAIPALKNIAKRQDEDPRAREQAIWAIKRIAEINGDGDVYRD